MKKLTTKEFIEKATCIHGNAYEYTYADYKHSKEKLIITCSLHGNFLQTPAAHLNGQGCALCRDVTTGNRFRKSKKQFLIDAENIHGKEYDYSSVIYYDSHTKVEIICAKHGSFWQRPLSHINNRHRCPGCVSNISKMETQWLDSLNIPYENRQKFLYIGNQRIKTDAFDPATNTIYEFWGDYWHGNPLRYDSSEINRRNKKSFGDLYKQTQIKRNLILSAGYNLVEKWETE